VAQVEALLAAGDVPVSPGDIVTLNVGGTVFTTSRATLTLVPDSLLGVMFRWVAGGRARVVKSKASGCRGGWHEQAERNAKGGGVASCQTRALLGPVGTLSHATWECRPMCCPWLAGAAVGAAKTSLPNNTLK
jgi:hypothetical protein